jgi:hypothetical protein
MSPYNRPVGVKRFQTIHRCGVMSLAGSCFSGIGTKAGLKGPLSRNSEYHMQQIVVVQFAYPLGPGDC